MDSVTSDGISDEPDLVLRQFDCVAFATTVEQGRAGLLSSIVPTAARIANAVRLNRLGTSELRELCTASETISRTCNNPFMGPHVVGCPDCLRLVTGIQGLN